jgi:capsular polysaccharide biosynthesis protein
MELRQYWNVIWKRRWLVLAVVALAAVASAFMALTAKRYYEAEVRFITRQDTAGTNVGQAVNIEGQVVFMFDPYYYRWFGSEFLVDDYTQITTSDAFANSVLQTMREESFAEELIEDMNNQVREAADPDDTPVLYGDAELKLLEENIEELKLSDVKEAIASDRRHRELRLTITGTSMELTKAIADAASRVLTDARLQPILGDPVNDRAAFAQIDRVGPDNISSSRSQEIINAVVRVVMALVAALALAFLLEYLDTSLRDERDAEKVLDLPVLGAIPRV